MTFATSSHYKCSKLDSKRSSLLVSASLEGGGVEKDQNQHVTPLYKTKYPVCFQGMTGIFISSLVFLIIGVTLIYKGVKSYQLGQWLKQHGKRTSGKIERLVKRGNMRDMSYHPEVSFLLPNGEPTRKVLAMPALHRWVYKKGEKVRVVFDPDNPTDCEIDTNIRLTTLPLLQIIFGMLSLSGMTYMIVIGL